MGKSRSKRYYEDDSDFDDEYRNEKFRNRRQVRLKRVHDKQEEMEDGEEAPGYS